METKDKQTKSYRRSPNMDMRAKLSQDGRYWIIERIETWILPANYLSAISRNHALKQISSPDRKSEPRPKKKGKRNAESNG